MSKLVCLLTVFVMGIGAHAFAQQEEPKCPEGQVFSSDEGKCVPAPTKDTPVQEDSQ